MHLELNRKFFFFCLHNVLGDRKSSSIKYFLFVDDHVSYTTDATSLYYGYTIPYPAAAGDKGRAAVKKATSSINMAYHW